MKITNKQNLPQAIVNALTSDYQYKDKQFSATTILSGIKSFLLMKRHTNEIEMDASEGINMLLGTAVHNIFESNSKDEELAEQMIGVEICNNDKVLFRGGILDFGDDYWLYNEDGTLDNFGFTYVTGDGIERDENGNVIDKMEPSASTIYELLNDPELTHKGEALAWFGAVFICILNVLSILFADELFRWNLLFQIRNVENAEPSDWEIAGRYIGWTVMTIMSLVIFIIGLQ